jgi:hypothetical protein
MVYDAFGRQRFWYFPMPATTGAANAGDYEEYRYDPAGNRIWLRKRDGSVLTYAFDALNRMSQKNVPVSATSAAGYSVFYGYDLRGLQTYARFGSASGLGVTNQYDGFGRLSSSTTTVDGAARTMASQYDSDGNRTLLTGPWGYYAPFAYDGLGRVTGNANITLFGYDSAGRRSSLAMGPGWTSSAVGYQYDEAGRLKTLTHDLAGTSGDQALGFAYNPASRIVARTATNDAYAAPAPAVGSKAYGVNRMWLKTMPDPAGHVRYLYDLRGLQTDAWYPWTGEGISNRYDGFGRLIETTSTMGGFARKIAHAFDRDGRRVELTWSDQAKIWFTRDRLGRIREGYQGALGTTSTIMIAFAYNSGGPPHYFARRGGGSPTNMTGSAVPSRRPARRAGSRAPSATPSTATAGGWSRAGPIRPGSGSPATS